MSLQLDHAPDFVLKRDLATSDQLGIESPPATSAVSTGA